MQLFECGTLLDGTGSGPLQDARVLVEDGRVREVGTVEDVADPDGAEWIDYRDETVLPGLIDAHVHLQGVRSMNPLQWSFERDSLATARATADCRDLLAAGFTTVRDLGSSTAYGLRDAITAGEIPGPRIYTSGPAISQTGGHGDVHSLPYEWASDSSALATLADGETECRREVRKRSRADADCLKIMTTGGVLSENDDPRERQFTRGEIETMVEEADRVGLPVASHAQGTAGIAAALDAGVDTIEHAFFLDDETIDLLLETDTVVVPTLAIMDRVVEHGADHGVPPHAVHKATEAFEAHVASIRAAVDAGVPIATGTDFIGPELVPHGENAHELSLLVERIGMDEQAVVHAATGVAARTIPDDDVGRLEPGAWADLVVADDPLSDIEALSEPRAVYKGGTRVADNNW